MYERTTLRMQSSRTPANVLKDKRRTKKATAENIQGYEPRSRGWKKKEVTEEAFGWRCEFHVAVSGGARNRLSAGSIEEGGYPPTVEGAGGVAELQRKRWRGGRREEGNDGGKRG